MKGPGEIRKRTDKKESATSRMKAKVGGGGEKVVAVGE